MNASNHLPILAERIRQATERAKSASIESAAQYLAAGRLLIEAKTECQHGEWGPFLEKAGIHERQARRLMQLARSGLKADTVSDLGGVKAALAYLAERRVPGDGEALFVRTDGEDVAALIWQDAEHHGFYHALTIDLRQPAPSVVISTTKSVTAEPLQLPDGTFCNPLWRTVEAQIGTSPTDFRFTVIPPEEARHHVGEFCATWQEVVQWQA